VGSPGDLVSRNANLGAFQFGRTLSSQDRLGRSDLSRIDSNLSVTSDMDGEDQDPASFDWLDEYKEKARNKPVMKACVNCKRAHLACDNERPCRRYVADYLFFFLSFQCPKKENCSCITANKQDSCVDVEHKKRGRPKLQKTKSDGSVGHSANATPPGLLGMDNLELDSPRTAFRAQARFLVCFLFICFVPNVQK